MSQQTDIIRHLKQRPITPIEALDQYGCFRLAARIKDLRGLGHNIETNIVERGDKRWAEYRLVD